MTVTLSEIADNHAIEQLDKSNQDICLTDMRFFYDPLTGLPNRAKFDHYLSMLRLKDNVLNCGIAVIIIDLDKFKEINDTLGYDMGDKLIIKVSEVLASMLSNDNYILARTGGDEFGIIVSPYSMTEEIEGLVKAVILAIERPFLIEDYELHVTVSIGISQFPKDGESTDAIKKSAGIAMYESRRQGGNTYSFYTSKTSHRKYDEAGLVREMNQALESNRYMLFYQPKINLKTGCIDSLEALIRLQSTDLGIIGPDKFIPLAEKTGLIISLGEWVLRNACMQIKAWQDKGTPPMRVAVNISARQLRHRNFYEKVISIIEETEVEPTYLELEITESSVISNINSANIILKQLREHGIRVSMDDFGTGYSSLSYLREISIDTLKIDRSFLKDLCGDSGKKAIVAAIINMAHGLGLSVVAEGIETVKQLKFLVGEQCDFGQGYLFSKPISAYETERMLGKQKPLFRWA